MGWEPTETHTHEYDEQGRLIRTTVTREAEWDDVQRAYLLALADYRADLCACGFPAAVADQDPELQVKYRECPVCAGLARVGRLQASADANLIRRVYGNKGPQPGDELPTDGRHAVGLESTATAAAADAFLE